MPAIIGINEVGHVEAGPTDVPWGCTAQDGAQLGLSTDVVDLFCGQSTMKYDVHLVSVGMTLEVRMVDADLQVLQRVWGLPDAAFTSGLPGSSDILTITASNLGTQERTLYVLGPGPASTRRLDIKRARVQDFDGLAFAANDYQIPAATWEVLKPTVGDPVVFTDAP